MLKTLVLSDDDELIKNISVFFGDKIVLEKNKTDKLIDYSIFILDSLNKKEIDELLNKINSSISCIININSSVTIEEQYNFKLPFKVIEIFKILENFIDFYSKNVIEISNTIKFNTKDRYIIVENENISLTEKECELVEFLHKNKESTREDILKNIWRRGENPDFKVLDTVIYGIKQKLKKNIIVLNNNHYELEI
jgi:hypothetical protein